MEATATIRARIPEAEKKAFEEVLSSIGLDTSTFMRLAIRQTIIRRAVPFSLDALPKSPRKASIQELSARTNARFAKACEMLAKN